MRRHRTRRNRRGAWDVAEAWCARVPDPCHAYGKGLVRQLDDIECSDTGALGLELTVAVGAAGATPELLPLCDFAHRFMMTPVHGVFLPSSAVACMTLSADIATLDGCCFAAHQHLLRRATAAVANRSGSFRETKPRRTAPSEQSSSQRPEEH
jgi:hypothetical protein